MKNRRDEMRNIWCSSSDSMTTKPSLAHHTSPSLAPHTSPATSPLISIAAAAAGSLPASLLGGAARLPSSLSPPPAYLRPPLTYAATALPPSSLTSNGGRGDRIGRSSSGVSNSNNPYGFSLTPLNIVEKGGGEEEELEGEEEDLVESRGSESPISDVEITA